tara:strand:- start:67 stop:408 length:342 start_codon:yes stop_codon:yes gene_type:complete
MTYYGDEDFKTIPEIVREEYNLERLLTFDKTKEVLETDAEINFNKNVLDSIRNIYKKYSETYNEYGVLDRIQDGGCYTLMDIIYKYIVKHYDTDVVFENDELTRYLYAKLTRE